MKTLIRNSILLAVLLVLPSNSRAQAPLEQANLIPGIHAELYSVDRLHSTMEFSVGFLGLSLVKGTFNNYSAAILYDPEDVTRTSVTFIADVSTIDTGSKRRDKDLQSERFFHAEAYPSILFESESIESTDYGLVATGQLTMRGVTRTVSFPIEHALKRTLDEGWGNVRIGFSGKLSVKRSDYGISGGDFWGIKVLSDDVQIEFFALGTVSNIERWGYSPAEKPTYAEIIEKTAAEEGIDIALEKFHYAREHQPDDYNFSSTDMNILGYRLLQRRQYADALKIFMMNAEENPDDAGLLDSVAEAYALLGYADEAIAYYRKAIELKPSLAGALEMVRRLEALDAYSSKSN